MKVHSHVKQTHFQKFRQVFNVENSIFNHIIQMLQKNTNTNSDNNISLFILLTYYHMLLKYALIQPVRNVKNWVTLSTQGQVTLEWIG